MIKKILNLGALGLLAVASFSSCSDEQQFTDFNTNAKKIDVQVLNAELSKVRDYVPLYAVIAHRGSTFWAPEETEASWRWARDMGADYLESDLQCTKEFPKSARHSTVRSPGKTAHPAISRKRTSKHAIKPNSPTTTATIRATTTMPNC